MSRKRSDRNRTISGHNRSLGSENRRRRKRGRALSWSPTSPMIFDGQLMDVPGSLAEESLRMKNKMEQSRRSTTTKSRVWESAVAILILTFFVAFLPWMVARTSLRNVVVNRLIADSHVHATVGGASFGWYSPLRLSALTLVHAGNQPQMQVQHIEAEKSWLQLALSAPALGNIEIDQPRIRI